MRRYRYLYCLVLSLLLSLSLSSETISIPNSSAQIYLERGVTAYRTGQPQTAIQHWQQALELSDYPQLQAKILGNLAVAYYEVGQYVDALDANQAALSLFTELEQIEAIGQVQGNLGNVYATLGDYDRAIAAYQISLQLAQKEQNRVAEGIITGNLGYLYFEQGDTTAALEAYEQAIAIARETGNLEGESHQLLNAGLVYYASEDRAIAAGLYQRSLEIARAIGHLALEAIALDHIGLLAAGAGDYETAFTYHGQSFALAAALQNKELMANILNNWGHSLLAADRLEEAEARLREAISHLDSLRLGLADTHSISTFDTQIYTYNLLMQVLIARNEPEIALEISEAGRSRAFAKLLAQRFNSTEAPSLSKTLAPITLDKIRQTAQKANATLVEYSLVPEEAFRAQGRQRGSTATIYIWVIQPDGHIEFRQQSIDFQTAPLERAIQTLHKAIGVPSRRQRAAQQLKALHQVLIHPIQELLPSNPEDRLIFMPQGSLFLIPFPSLIDDDGSYLIQHHTVLTAPSIQTLDLTYEQSRQPIELATALRPQDFLVVGNPVMPELWNPRQEEAIQLASLEWAEQEALEIANLFKTEALIGNAASEESVKERITNARIVHLATHGLLEYGHPQESGVRDTPGAIALSPSTGHDGLLTAAEILNELTLKADLVVVSACDTGLGDITGDGVVGLSRSLMAAGAPNVLVSLWAVPDAPTSDLMINFYQTLKSDWNKPQALRQAMLNMIKKDPDPSGWAAFTLIGTGS